MGEAKEATREEGRRISAVLVGGGDVAEEDLDHALQGGPLVIGVDGGGLVLERLGVTPDWLVGDLTL